MKILFIFTSTSPDDRKAWSGTMYQSFNSLRQAGFDMDYLCALRENENTLFDKLCWEYWKRVPKLLGKNARCDEAFYSVRIFSHTLRYFDYSPYDIIFIPTHIAIVNAVPKNIKAKIVHLADATVDSLFDYYTEFSNLIFHNYWEAHILGKQAFRRADLIIASSDWCRNNAIKDYGIAPQKIAVIEFGANINDIDIPARPKRIDNKKKLNIYWSGVNWARKGGDIALECCDELLRRGYDVTFNITGMKELPEYVAARPYIRNYGFLDKNKVDDYLKLIEIMSNQDIFLFPSKAECSSIALCEANGFGLPCFAYDTGGTGNYVINGVNGYMLPLDSCGHNFADKIIECLKNSEMDTLSEGAVKMYEEKFNWNTWGKRAKNIIQDMWLTDF